MGLTDINRTFHRMTTIYTFFSPQHGTFSKIDHMLGHKSNLYRFKGIETISSIFSDHDGIKLDLNFKRNPQKYSNTWKLNYLLLNDSTTMEEIKTEIKRFMEANNNEDKSFHNLWDTAKAVIRGKFIAISTHKRKTKRRQMDLLTSCLRELEKQQ